MTTGYCGIDCQHCKVYQATMMPAGEARSMAQEAIAAEWRVSFKYDFKAEAMVCHGCQSDQLCGYCQGCDIRKCGSAKQVADCRSCEDYPCQTVAAFRENALTQASEHVFVF